MKEVVITTGDPAGCGPQISLGAIYALRKEKIGFIVVGDSKIIAKDPLYKRIKHRIRLIDVNTPKIRALKFGLPSNLSGGAALRYLEVALKVMKNEGIARLVTAPVSKEACKKVLPNFIGHTEYLAKYFKADNFAMMMVSKKMKVVLFSRHIPLRQVPKLVKKKELVKVFTLVYFALQKIFKIKHPKIAITSVNPHAGVGTFLDKEEKNIAKAIHEFRKKVRPSGKIYGPLAADTVFLRKNLKNYHCIISSYHDQAMIPFKAFSFREGVNLTLGLPIVRTSPDHGVAYDLVKRRRKPFFSSMIQAIKLALRLKADYVA